MARHQLTQVAAEHPRACLNDMSWNPATSDQVIPPGIRHLIIGDSLVRDLNEILSMVRLPLCLLEEPQWLRSSR